MVLGSGESDGDGGVALAGTVVLGWKICLKRTKVVVVRLFILGVEGV